jgi:ABC-2 type transport system ATP-binding protein
MPRVATGLVALLLSLAVVTGGLAGCSSQDDGAPSAGGPQTTVPDAGSAHPCDLEAPPDPPTVERVEGAAASEHELTSFDGTTIRFHWFPVEGATSEDPAPTILMGPGWSESGDTSTTGSVLFDSLSIPGMWEQGYHVLTWDPRGFGESGGTATVNDPEAEGRDVQALIDWVSTQDLATQDSEGDPRIGMAGFSYGGGIQLTTAAIDCRVDAIVPGIAWHSLRTSLYPAETVKVGWSGLLVTSASEASLDPHIISAYKSGVETGVIGDEDAAWFESRGPGDLVDEITTPTLIIGGTVDNLFTLAESITIHRSLRDRDVATAMVWFCGGHGACLSSDGNAERVSEATFDWFARYLKGEGDRPRVAGFTTVDQDGDHWTGDAYPAPEGPTIEASGDGTLDLVPEGGSGGVEVPEGDLLGGVVASFTPSQATNALEVPIEVEDLDALALGAPRLTFTYQGTLQGKVPDPESRIYAQLVDDETGLVIGNQLTPIPVTLDGDERTATVDLEVIAHHVEPDDTLTLQLVAATTAYNGAILDGSTLEVEDLRLTIPTATGLTEE